MSGHCDSWDAYQNGTRKSGLEVMRTCRQDKNTDKMSCMYEINCTLFDAKAQKPSECVPPGDLQECSIRRHGTTHRLLHAKCICSEVLKGTPRTATLDVASYHRRLAHVHIAVDSTGTTATHASTESTDTTGGIYRRHIHGCVCVSVDAYAAVDPEEFTGICTCACGC